MGEAYQKNCRHDSDFLTKTRRSFWTKMKEIIIPYNYSWSELFFSPEEFEFGPKPELEGVPVKAFVRPRERLELREAESILSQLDISSYIIKMAGETLS
jgi:hypothetical protein